MSFLRLLRPIHAHRNLRLNELFACVTNCNSRSTFEEVTSVFGRFLVWNNSRGQILTSVLLPYQEWMADHGSTLMARRNSLAIGDTKYEVVAHGGLHCTNSHFSKQAHI